MCLGRAGRQVRAACLGEGRVFLGEGRASGGGQCVWVRAGHLVRAECLVWAGHLGEGNMFLGEGSMSG